jgi:hypothetical protein
MSGAGLDAALALDPEPSTVVAVVATAGTTNAGIIDDLAGIGEVARDRGLWFHVDGAYGGAALFAPSVRRRFDGIELADSLVVDPHKWLFAPFDCAALVYRSPMLAKGVHTQNARVPRLDPRPRRRVESDRLRVSPHAAGPRACHLVLDGRPRARRVLRGDRAIAGQPRAR